MRSGFYFSVVGGSPTKRNSNDFRISEPVEWFQNSQFAGCFVLEVNSCSWMCSGWRICAMSKCIMYNVYAYQCVPCTVQCAALLCETLAIVWLGLTFKLAKVQQQMIPANKRIITLHFTLFHSHFFPLRTHQQIAQNNTKHSIHSRTQ